MELDNGFKHAQQMYDRQEPPEEYIECDECINFDSEIQVNCFEAGDVKTDINTIKAGIWSLVAIMKGHIKALESLENKLNKEERP